MYMYYQVNGGCYQLLHNSVQYFLVHPTPPLPTTKHDRGVTTHHGLYTHPLSIPVIAHNYFTTPNYIHNYFGDTLHIAHMPSVSRV